MLAGPFLGAASPATWLSPCKGGPVALRTPSIPLRSSSDSVACNHSGQCSAAATPSPCPRLLASTADPRASSQSGHGTDGGSTGRSARSHCARCEIQCPGEPPAAPAATGGRWQLSQLNQHAVLRTSQQVYPHPQQTLLQYVMSKKVQEHFPSVSSRLQCYSPVQTGLSAGA